MIRAPSPGLEWFMPKDRRMTMILNKRGFTLIELIIVVIIIGILAAIAVPMMQTNTLKAKQTEVLAALGVIRSAERQYYVEYQAYTDVTSDQWTTAGPLGQYLSGPDFAGKYVPDYAYSVEADGATYVITCDSTTSSSPGGCGHPGAGEDLGVFTMNQNGETSYTPPSS